jgi:hypothetical protein
MENQDKMSILTSFESVLISLFHFKKLYGIDNQ